MTLDVPPAWAELIVSLAAMSWHRLVVLGGTDADKSSFCRLLCSHLASRSQPVALLDADLGQKMIGPPACVSLARCIADGSLELERIRFVGEVSAATNVAGTVAATDRLAGAAGAARLVVYTSGLIHGPGIALKRWKLDALDPDHVVEIARTSDDLAPLVAALPPGRVHHLRPSTAARRKSPALREGNRRTSLLTALGDCRLEPMPVWWWRISIARRWDQDACARASSPMQLAMIGRSALSDGPTTLTDRKSGQPPSPSSRTALGSA
jgi:polynucleotide 5'-hydroxyl-kinase GRC3/NOL9